MKKTLIALCAISIFACQEEAPKDYVTFSGKITNPNSDSIVLRTPDYSKTISVNDDGTFSDTLKVKTGVYNFFDGKESTSVFLKNGFDISMTLNTEQFDETAKYSGIGSEHSNFLAQQALKEEQLIDFDRLSKIEEMDILEQNLNDIKSELSAFYDSNKNIDTTIVNNAKKNLEPMLNMYKKYIGESITLKKELPKGAESPKFNDYENVDGSTTSLDDLKGKYVYIDVWATWCGPCKAEIPALKAIEKEYHDKNIQFVSLSIDDGAGYKADTPEERAKLAKEGWKNMIAEKELGGIQVIAPNGWKSDFVEAYKISGIPRFIIVDPEGNVVSPDAPRPSSDEIKTLFNSLDI